MNEQLIPHVFGSLHTLERYFERIQALIGTAENASQINKLLPEYERFLEHMRRTANKLQLHVASQNISAVVRDLRIFYGLNHLIRPELLNTLARLSKGEPSAARESEQIAAPQLGH